MSRIPLSNTGDWKLKFDEQDVRGFDAVDANGTRLGEIDTMMVNTDQRRVDAIVLEDGQEIPAKEISIGDGVVYFTREVNDDIAGSVTVYDDYGHVVEREAVDEPDYDAYTDDFRTHHTETYGATGDDYTAYEPAYQYGYKTAYDDSFRNRTYADAETDIKQRYTQNNPGRKYDEVRDAVRYAYTRAQRGR